ncbi:MAG: hypothetical protein J6A41_02835 [Ruminiclostridium sp.]|nr:hypothetical protein [Ruminiclostridium sp.]
MKPTITIESSRNILGEYLLVNVVNGKGIIGICDTTRNPGTVRRSLFVGSESLVSISSPDDETSNRQIWQNSSIDKCKNVLGTKLKHVVEDYFYEGVPLAKAVQPVLEMLTDGLYIVHEGTAYPTDGAGNFFWNAYFVRHELNGTAPSIPAIGKNKVFAPAFLVPTQGFSMYSEKNISVAAARIKKGRRIGGLAYHLTGMFSALLSGHTNACACLARGEDFPCITIEPVSDVLYLHDEITDKDRILALSAPYAKLPLEAISRSVLENFLLNRRVSVPEFYPAIRAKADKPLVLKGGVKGISSLISDNIEKLPDAEMLASAFAISELPDEHLQLLLAGETKINDQVIISANYYESIVYACNFLQYKDKRRFIEFTTTILNTPALAATYKYVAERLRFEMDAKINELFKNIKESEDPIYVPIKEIAEKYLIRYHEHMEKSVNQYIGAEPELIIEAQPEPKKGKAKANESVEALARLRDGSGAAAPAEGEKEYSSLELAKKVANAPKPKHKES